MAKQLIINAIEPREVRAAILENGEPTHFFVERSKRRFQKGNIYRARVTSIEPHLQAAFVELEKGQHGFLGISDIILPDAGVSLINGQPAPPFPGEEEESKQEKSSEENKVNEEEQEKEGRVLLDESSSPAPAKNEPKPEPIELSPVAGDMLLGLETDLNSPIQAVETQSEEQNSENSEAVKEEAEPAKVTEPLIETCETQDTVLAEPETKAEEPTPEENKIEEKESEAGNALLSEEKSSESTETDSDTTEESEPKSSDTETFIEGDDVDTAIFSIDDEPLIEENTEQAETDNNEPAEEKTEENETEQKEIKIPSEPKGRFRPRHRHHKHKSNFNNNRRRRPNMKIEDVLEVGQYITVQIIKEGIGNKAPMVSTYLSIAGHYMVLTPGGDRSGVSKQVRVQAERTRLKKFLDDNKIPDRCGLIVRTAAEGISEQDLKADIDNLTNIWEDLQSSFKKLNRAGVIKQEEALASRLVRDYYQQDIEEVWIDDKDTYEEIKSVFEKGMSEQVDRLHLFEEPSSIFYHYNVEAAIKGLFNRKVNLPGGGSLIFDQNEAMLVIDINSGTFKEGEDDEDTAFKLNMLACKEIARQVQMRDVGGIVMIDFVDMRRLGNRSKVEKELEKSFKGDKARINIMHIGALGVLQMSRQRTKDSLRANLYSTCPHCDGTGLVPSKTHSAMSILREVRSNIKRYKGSCLKIKTTADLAMDLLNNYKGELSSLEEKEGAQIQIDIDPKLKVGEFNLDNKNPPKRSQDQAKSAEGGNKKKRRNRKNKKKDHETAPAEATAATPEKTEHDETMTNRLERMEKEFPSDSLGIIKAPKPENEAAAQNGEPQSQLEETKETGSKATEQTSETQATSDKKVASANTAVEEKSVQEELKAESKPKAKKAAKRKPSPKRDETETSSSAEENTEQDNEKVKTKPKAKAKTSAKKKAATKKTSAKKTATKTKKAAASKPKSNDSPKSEE